MEGDELMAMNAEIDDVSSVVTGVHNYKYIYIYIFVAITKYQLFYN